MDSHTRDRHVRGAFPIRRRSGPFKSAFHVICRGFGISMRGLSLSFRRSMSGYHHYHHHHHHQDKILDPQDPILQEWNKLLLTSCVLSLAVDPLFFYIPLINRKETCLEFDPTLKIVACVLRTSADLFYLLHIFIQFRTGFISPSSRVVGRGELVNDPAAIAKRYLLSYFFVDVLAILPLPQVVVLFIIPRVPGLLKGVIIAQYAPRLFRMFPLYEEVTGTSGIITETAWAGASFNMLLYMLASHFVGAGWYLLAIDRQKKCWHDSCKGPGCNHLFPYCGVQRGSYTLNETFCALVDPDQIMDSSSFNFGIYYDLLRLEIVERHHFSLKFLYCFWWGLRSLSSLGQDLETSTSVGEILYAGFVGVLGLFLFSLLIGNVQKYLQATTVRAEEMRVIRRLDAEKWMSHRLLPDHLRKRVRRYEQYKWQKTRGVDEESLLSNLPRDLRRDIKRHLCSDLLRRVPLFEVMDDRLIDAMCDLLKPVLYIEGSIIVCEGDPVYEMLFIMKGMLVSTGIKGGAVSLQAGDFCGEELLTWALDPRLGSSNHLPSSTRTVQARTDVEAFALMPEDLSFVVTQFSRLHSRQVKHTFRFYSQQWRTWAACYIQAAWRRHRRRKLDNSVRETEDRFKNTLANNTRGSSLSLGATVYASRFAVNALRLRKSIVKASKGKEKADQRIPRPTIDACSSSFDYAPKVVSAEQRMDQLELQVAQLQRALDEERRNSEQRYKQLLDLLISRNKQPSALIPCP